MVQIDEQTAARVWQRVQGSPAALSSDLSADIQGFILQEREDAHTYRCLMTYHRNRHLQQLIRETDNTIASLEGLQQLLWGTPKENYSVQRTCGLSAPALRRCYHGTCQRMSQYSRLSSHSAAGPVFSQLAAGASRRCSLLALLASEISD